MTVLFVPRSAWFAGTPTSNAGNPRPLLKKPVPTITRHYTGAPPLARAYTWPASDFMPDFQRIALAAGKSYEYSYVIPPRADGSAQVWEYAGAYQAAHSVGENDVAIGVLFCIGVTNHPSFKNYDPTRPTVWEECTDAMVDAYRWLRDVHLADAGLVNTAVEELEHFLMPGAATACPGQSVIGRGTDLDAPYANPAPPEDDDVTIKYFKLPFNTVNPITVWATSDDLNAERLTPEAAVARGVDLGAVPTITAAEAERYLYPGGLPVASVR